MKVLIACEFSGVVRDAFIRAGHDAISCDFDPSESTFGPHYQGDVFDIINDGFDLMVAHPPCTFLCNSGVKHLYIDGNKTNGRYLPRWEAMRKGAEFFKRLLNVKTIKKRAVENPIMHGYAKRIIGRPQNQVVQPYWFGDKKMKASCWWLENLEELIRTNDVGPPPLSGTSEYGQWAECHHASPGKDRSKIRSTFCLGMADALPVQWGK